jgi:hypothetical protein
MFDREKKEEKKKEKYDTYLRNLKNFSMKANEISLFFDDIILFSSSLSSNANYFSLFYFKNTNILLMRKNTHAYMHTPNVC